MPVETIDRYEILAEIGQGGMATVYRARDPQGAADVAVKVLRREYLTDLGFRARFQREAQTIAALQHPALVPVLDFGQYQEQLYLVMPYMLGGSLALRLLRGPLPAEEAGEVLARIAAALDAAHGQGVVHRDLKPSNILFDAGGQAHLADFGIAVQTGSEASGADVIDGTPAYMSPEQCRSQGDVDGRSDVYSLGVTLFQMLTGRPPFDGDTALVILTQHIYESPPPLCSLNPEAPEALEPVVQTALAKEPAARYQTAGALADAYERALARSDVVGAVADGADEEAVEAAPESYAIVYPPVAAAEPVERESALRERLPAPLLRAVEAYGPWLVQRFYLALVLVSLLGVACALGAVMVVRGSDALAVWGSGNGAAASGTPSADRGVVAESVSPTSAAFLPFIDAAPPGESGVTPTPEATATPGPNLLLLYSTEAATAINVSGGELSLAGVTFRRPASEAAGAAAFRADEWRGVAGNRLDALPPGDCLQLVRLGGGRTGPQKPVACNKLRGWLGTSRMERLFFLPETGAEAFEVLRGEEVIGVCAMADGECRLRLPGS